MPVARFPADRARPQTGESTFPHQVAAQLCLVDKVGLLCIYAAKTLVSPCYFNDNARLLDRAGLAGALFLHISAPKTGHLCFTHVLSPQITENASPLKTHSDAMRPYDHAVRLSANVLSFSKGRSAGFPVGPVNGETRSGPHPIWHPLRCAGSEAIKMYYEIGGELPKPEQRCPRSVSSSCAAFADTGAARVVDPRTAPLQGGKKEKDTSVCGRGWQITECLCKTKTRSDSLRIKTGRDPQPNAVRRGRTDSTAMVAVFLLKHGKPRRFRHRLRERGFLRKPAPASCP